MRVTGRGFRVEGANWTVSAFVTGRAPLLLANRVTGVGE